MDTGEPRGIALVSQARRDLEEASTINEAKTIMDKAALAKVLAKKAKLGLEAQNEAAEVNIQAQRLLGRLIREGQESGEIASNKTGRPDKCNTVVHLSDLGISRNESSRSKKIESIPEEELDAKINEVKGAGQELTSAAMLKLAKKLDRQKKDAELTPVKVIADKSPALIVGYAESLDLPDGCVDLIITSPPYNLETGHWPMGGNGRSPRSAGIGYDDDLQLIDYMRWQVDVLNELYRVASPGASLFYNHKPRNKDGQLIHPMAWILDESNPWTLRQEIIWDRGSTHNHSASLFWPEDERIYWLTKGKPDLPDKPIGLSTVWKFHGPVASTWHPAPFDEQLPQRCIEAIGREGITVLDPFAGSCTTAKVALDYGYDAIAVDISVDYLLKAAIENGWEHGRLET